MALKPAAWDGYFALRDTHEPKIVLWNPKTTFWMASATEPLILAEKAYIRKHWSDETKYESLAQQPTSHVCYRRVPGVDIMRDTICDSGAIGGICEVRGERPSSFAPLDLANQTLCPPTAASVFTFEVQPGKCRDPDEIQREETVDSAFLCTEACRRRDWCHGFNVVQMPDGRVKCQLATTTDVIKFAVSSGPSGGQCVYYARTPQPFDHYCVDG
jgi:hypothetical protein